MLVAVALAAASTGAECSGTKLNDHNTDLSGCEDVYAKRSTTNECYDYDLITQVNCVDSCANFFGEYFDADGNPYYAQCVATGANYNQCASADTPCTSSGAGDGGNDDYPAPAPNPPPPPAPTPAPDDDASPTTASVKAYIQKLITDGKAEFGNTEVTLATYNAMTLAVPAETNDAMDATVTFAEGEVTDCEVEAMIGLIRNHMKNEYPGRDVTVSGCDGISCTELDVCPAESRLSRAAQAGRRGRRATERTATITVGAGGLSAGEIAGIVIGSVVGAALLGGLIYYQVKSGGGLGGSAPGNGYFAMNAETKI